MSELSAIRGAIQSFNLGDLGVTVTYPAAGSAAAAPLSSTTAWDPGPYATIVSSGTLGSHILTGFLVTPGTVGIYYVTIGTGSSGGGEVSVGEWPLVLSSTGTTLYTPVWKRVPSGARVAVSVRSNQTSVGPSVYATFLPRPRT